MSREAVASAIISSRRRSAVPVTLPSYPCI
jgi:hypothetical protein